MANSERIYLIQGNDTDMSVCLRKGGDTPLPYDLTGASRIGLALTGHGLSFFARDIVVSGEDNNIISGLLAGDLLVGEYGLEVSFTLDGKAKRFRVPQVFEVVSYLSEDQDGTAEGEGDGISITVTVQPEVIEIAGPTGPQGHDGKSAYEVWLEDGHTGTEDDFFKWLAAEGLPWNDVDISSLTVRNGYITSSGVWNSGSTYCHTLLPVSAGKAVRVTAAESNLFRYAWLTSGQAPRGGIAADLVPGTERTDVAAGSSVTLDVPEGAKYLYIYLGAPADKANTPESLAVSDTISSLRKDIDSTGADVSDIDDRIGYPGVYGALEGAGTAIVYARQVHVAGGQSYRVNMLHPDVTVTSPTGNAYRFVVSARNGEGAELSKLVQVVDTAALKDYYDITAPDGASYLLIYGRCSSGETCDFTVDPLTTRTYNDGDILTLNPDSEFQPKWQSASKPYYTSQSTNKPNCVRFLHLSDVHGNWANVRRFLKFYNHWVDKGYDITAINTGDTATDYLTDGVTGYTGIAGADKILGVIGNHDTRGAQGWQQYKGLEVYNALFAPLISGWGVVQPEGAAENGYCYYHKDYASNKLRLVVVDIMGYDDTEDAWLASVLASAKTAGYHVLIATHFAGGRSSAEASQPPYKKIDCQWSTMAGLASDSTQLNGYNSESYKMADTVHAFMEDGGIFCGYMCGHSHLEFVARLDKYPDQMIYTIGSSKSGKVHDYTHTTGTRMQDEFEIVAVDTDSKFVKLYKVGANYDRRGRLKDSICVSYDTHEVVGFPVTTEALAKEMDGKQEKLVSGQNIKTINGFSILGGGDLHFPGPVQSDWNEDDDGDEAYIKNKPVIPTDVVKYTEQTLTDAQKAQARTNIAAASESEVSQLRTDVDEIGIKSATIQTADVDLLGAIINSSGVWTATTYYRHIIIPVIPGNVVNYTANADHNSNYAFLTSDEAPVASVAAPLVPGTSRVLVEPGTNATFTIPQGTKFLYLSAGDTRINDGRANLPATITISQTLESRLEKYDEDGDKLNEVIGEKTLDLSLFNSRNGALSNSNTWLNAARYYHILIPVVVGDEVTITAKGGYFTRYGLLKSDEQAVTGEAAAVVSGTSRVEIAPASTAVISIPPKCNFLYLYGGDANSGASHIRDYLPAVVSVKTSIGALLDIAENCGVQYSGGIIEANPDSEWLPKMVAAKKRYYTSSVTDKPSPVVFAHLSDIHANWSNVRRFVDFTKHHESYIDGLLNTGDTVAGLFTDGIYGYGMGSIVASIMNVVGNHDTRGAQGWQQYVGPDIYNALIAPYVDGWGVTQPADAATNGYCYYYKDYAAQSLRLVVVDIMGYDSTEDTWLAGVLDSAKSSGYHVVIATHFAGGRDGEHQSENAFNVIECNYSTLQMSSGNASGLYGYNALAYMMTQTVKDFIDGGGKFVGYIQGHYHLDFVAKLAEDPRQLIYAIGSSKVGETRDYNHVGATRMQDEFQIISIDTYMKTVRLFKVGANIDQFGRSKNSVCINYESGTVVAQGF